MVRRHTNFFLVLALLCGSIWGCSAQRPEPVVPRPVGQEILPRVGLALGGGGSRGFAEIGVLRVLEQEHIPIDLVVGTSVGSLIGVSIAG